MFFDIPIENFNHFRYLNWNYLNLKAVAYYSYPFSRDVYLFEMKYKIAMIDQFVEGYKKLKMVRKAEDAISKDLHP